MILGIETSCDETAAAVVAEDVGVQVQRRRVVARAALQIQRVVPELAGRAQLDAVGPVVEEALEDAGLDVRAPASTRSPSRRGPGLVGSLLVGLSFAKSLATVGGPRSWA